MDHLLSKEKEKTKRLRKRMFCLVLREL